MLVVDVSGSMGDDDGTGRIKIDGAKIALLNFLAGVEPGTPIGLRTFPDQQSGTNCNTGSVQFPIAPRDPAEMSAFIRSLQASGDTPTAEAMGAAADDLRASGYSHGTLVLLSDGESTCANPCDEAKKIAQSGIAIQTITIGFRISQQGEQELKCIAGAMNGKYFDASDSAGLAKAFDQLSRPTLSVQLSYPSKVVAEVGNDPNGQVAIHASITNTSQVEAQNVVTRLRFDANAPGVTNPVFDVGNLAPGGTRTLTWTFRPSLLLAGKTVKFSVVTYAANTISDAQSSGSVLITDEAAARFAGPILKGRTQLAILGDSYSAGEGADSYLTGTDNTTNACHRSRFTYLMQAFHQPASSVIACSGAVVADIYAGQASDDVPSQLEQLQSLIKNRGVDAVAMTLGGNDARFGKIVASCVLPMPSDCSRLIYPSAPWPGTWVSSDQFVAEVLDGLSGSLENAYIAINAVLNSEGAVKQRHGAVAPIFVLGYPLPIPLTGRACLAMVDQFSAGEISFLGGYATKLNGTIEGAVDAAHQRGVPVLYIPNTEEAFLPDHTVCDRTPYARALDSFNLAGFDLTHLVEGILGGGTRSAVLNEFNRGKQELLHPNQAGYTAMTDAVIRWSLSDAARSDADWLRTADPSTISPPKPVTLSNQDLGQLQPSSSATLQNATSYPLSVNGFAPGSPIEITVHSQSRVLELLHANASGRLKTRIALPPDTPPGRHELVITGVAANGTARTLSIPIRVAGHTQPLLIRAIATVAVGSGLLAVLLWIVLTLRRIFTRRNRAVRSPG